MSYIHKPFFLAFILLLSSTVHAQHFASALLRQSAEALHLQGLEELPSGYSAIIRSGSSLSIVKRGDRIDHIGRLIFPQQLREMNPLPVYDYLEFAWLEQSLLSPENPNKYKEVNFETGDWNTLQKVSAETPCSVSIDDGARYHLTWSLPEGKELHVSIPVNYEIISTATRGELERNMIADLRGHKALLSACPTPDLQQLKQQENGLYALEGDRYILSSINSNTYYTVTEGENPQLVCDTTDVAATLQNLFCAADTLGKDWDLHLLFSLHESRQDTLSVHVSDFTDYLKSTGCSVFWGNEGVSDDEVCGSVFAYCSAGGYNHIFKVKYRPQNGHHLSCTASLYVPTTNIRDLHMQYKPKKDSEKIKWK